MRLSLAALAQIGRLPTPPAAALEAVSSETKVRDFFREVRVIGQGERTRAESEETMEDEWTISSQKNNDRPRPRPPSSQSAHPPSLSRSLPSQPTTDLPLRPLGREKLPPRGHDNARRAPPQRRRPL